ncbi:hypothetical protein BP5796_05240 [Coleophoma crateriformis]|uniref:Major facilitator superfamily (MFS) profile domain-containing protein n=1 Tax=Coleophoma crateriformis TaxID=565419 RepID=A0A3D8S2M0_9HELO|nr:hypothetical protein BP5796_05240 [Coleophoma crateriformis]
MSENKEIRLSGEREQDQLSTQGNSNKSATRPKGDAIWLEEGGRYVHKYHGFTLVPQPSNDPRDPLNWPFKRKMEILVVLCLSTFAGFCGPLAGQLQVNPQATLYDVSTVSISYQNSAANSGMVIGSILLFPLSHVIGRSSTIFWSLVGLFVAQIWSACMTSPNDYNPWIVARGFSGFFGTMTGILGPRCLIDMFYLHQRGRAFTVFHFFFDFGTIAGPAISGLIAARSSWTAAYWWTAALAGVAFITVFIFLRDTTWDRSPGADNPPQPESFWKNRASTFLPGTAITKKSTGSQIAKVAATPFLITATPVTFFLALFCLFNFGFYVAMNSITPVWLQKPEKAGGYGFTSFENACFQLFHWAGIAVALLYGQLISDRLPLALCARFGGGEWKPEYRLHALWFPALICNPIGLGVFGMGLQQHLSWGVLAIAQILVTFGSLSITPITVNYACECFTKNPAETAIVLNSFRIGFGLSIAFYITPWVDAVGFAWCYGTMAFIQVFSFCFVVVLMWKGHTIRQVDPFGLISTEEGEHVVDDAKYPEHEAV